MTRVRFAPSPTGYLHVGGLRTALYNDLFAKKNGGILILRIEDTDRTRLVEDGVENIIRTLNWAGVVMDEGPYIDAEGVVRQKGDFGPYIQSERLDIYKKYADQLIAEGKAYYCFCCTDRLREMREKQQAEGGRTMYDRHCRDLSETDINEKITAGIPYVVRLKVPVTGSVSWDDLIRGKIEVANSQIDDQVLLKSDGYPTYHLANVVDDHLMKITEVIRGEEWCPSTPKHILLYRAFGWPEPKFAHLPLLLNPDKTKLSKRQGDVAVEDYKEKGYLKEALINFIALLGWNPCGDREIYTKEELISAFDISKINKGGAVFDLCKLEWMNSEYIKSISTLELAAVTLPFYEKSGLVKRQGYQIMNGLDGTEITLEWLAKVVSLEQDRSKTLNEIVQATDFLFMNRLSYESEIIPWKNSTVSEAKDRLLGLLKYIEESDDNIFESTQSLSDSIIKHISDNGWTNAETLWPLRVALTAKKASPSPFEVAWVIGKNAVISRIKDALAVLK